MKIVWRRRGELKCRGEKLRLREHPSRGELREESVGKGVSLRRMR